MAQDGVRIMLGKIVNEKRICMFTSKNVFEKDRNDIIVWSTKFLFEPIYRPNN